MPSARSAACLNAFAACLLAASAPWAAPQADPAGAATATLEPSAPACTQGDTGPLSARHQRGVEVLNALNRGRPQPVFETLRRDFPFLADATASYALGDVWGRPVLDTRTRQLAATAAFGALGLRGFYKTHAAYALDAGVPPEELKEVVYLLTVVAGFPRAIEASQALQELLVERGKSAAAAPPTAPAHR